MPLIVKYIIHNNKYLAIRSEYAKPEPRCGLLENLFFTEVPRDI